MFMFTGTTLFLQSVDHFYIQGVALYRPSVFATQNIARSMSPVVRYCLRSVSHNAFSYDASKINVSANEVVG
jgi:hypothetical protein